MFTEIVELNKKLEVLASVDKDVNKSMLNDFNKMANQLFATYCVMSRTVNEQYNKKVKQVDEELKLLQEVYDGGDYQDSGYYKRRIVLEEEIEACKKIKKLLEGSQPTMKDHIMELMVKYGDFMGIFNKVIKEDFVSEQVYNHYFGKVTGDDTGVIRWSHGHENEVYFNHLEKLCDMALELDK